jgi:L-fucose isomerase-like protein
MAEMGYTFNYVVTSRGGAVPVAKVATYCRAAAAAARLRKARIGMAGYRDMRLYGTLYDGISLKGRIGPEIEHFDLLELRDLMESVGGDEVEAFSREVKARWIFMREPRAGTIENSVRLSLAIRRKIEDRGYSAFSFSDVDGVKKLMKFAPAGALTLLHDQISLPTIPENDSLGSVTQLMVHYLTGQVGAYLEFYEFMENGVMMGVPDYVPAEIVDGRVTVLPNAFGSFGEGLLNVSAIKTGRVTLARLGMAGGDYRMHVVTGEAQRPILWEEAGWAPPAPRLPSLDIVIDGSMEDFTGKVMGQHYILSYGDNREGLSDLCSILGIERV